MRKLLKGAFSIVMTAALGLSMVSAAFADTAPTVKLPVTIELTGSVPSAAEEFAVVLTPEDGDCPMPEGSADGTFTLKIAGAATKELGPIVYPKLGVYHYTIHQEPGTNSWATYDIKVYNMTVYVTNDEENGGLKTTTAVSSGNVADKYTAIVFTNDYARTPGGGDPDGPGGGDPDGPGGDPSDPGGHGGGPHGPSTPGGPGDGLTIIDEAPPLAELIPETQIPLGNLPKTGDTTNIALWLTLMALSGCGLIGLLAARKRMEA